MRLLIIFSFLITSCSSNTLYLFNEDYTPKRNNYGIYDQNGKISLKKSKAILERISNKDCSYRISVGLKNIVYPVFSLDSDTIVINSVSKRLRPQIEKFLSDSSKELAMTLLLLNIDKPPIVPDSVPYAISDSGEITINLTDLEDLTFNRYIEFYKEKQTETSKGIREQEKKE